MALMQATSVSAHVATAIATLSDDAHDPIAYLNARTAASGGVPRGLSETIRSTQALLVDLEVASTACTNQLDNLIDEMIRVAPRLGYDVELLRGDLHTVSEQVVKAEPRRRSLAEAGGSALQVLDECDVVKTKLLKVREVLDAAKAWSPPARCEDDVRVYVEMKQWASASEAIVSYEKLLRVWRGTSGFDERDAALGRSRRVLTEARIREQQQLQQLQQTLQYRVVRNEEDNRRTSLDSRRSDDTVDSGYYSSFLRKIRG